MAEMSPRTKRRVDQIKKVSISRVLADYGYPVRPDVDTHEQQYPCDFHGDGLDNKPSARTYPETNSTHCFACGKSRDAIELCRAKEGVGFMEALRILEARYDLPTVPWEPSDTERQPTADEEIRARLSHPDRTFQEEIRIFRSLLDGETKDRSLPMDTTLAFWEASDQIEYWVNEEILSEVKGRAAIQKMLERLHTAIKEAYNAGTPGTILPGH